MTVIYYFLILFVAGMVLFAFVSGAVKLQNVQPVLANIVTSINSRRAKHLYRGFYLLGRAFFSMAAMLILGLLELFVGDSDEDENVETRRDSNGCVWYRSGGSWYSLSADQDITGPWD